MRKFFPAILFLIPALVAVGCAKPDMDFVKIKIGMTKDEVITNLGKPTKIAVINNLEIFEFEAYDRAGAIIINRRYQFVRFVNGKVESFGNKGDFDSTKNPTTEQKIDLKVTGTPANSNQPSLDKFDLSTELRKLEQLKKDGLISHQEYETLRQRAIDKAKVQ